MRAYLTERLRLEVGDRVVDQASLPGRQGRLALAFLLVEHHRPVPRDELADVLWAGAPPRSWEKGLAVVVSKLRAALAESGLGDRALTYAFGCYELHLPTDAWIDVEAAEDAVEFAETARGNDDAIEALRWAATAAEITRRTFLPGDEGLWVEARREALGVVLRRALECASAAALSLGDAVAATAAAREAVALEPYREQSYLHLIRAQTADGNRADALRTYERCRRLLSEELGVAPSPQTEEAYVALLGAETSAPTAPDSGSEHASSVTGAKVRYAKADDVYIAYQVIDCAGPDLLLFSTGMLPIDSMDEEPSLARFHARLASFRRLIRFDLRGVGLSDSVATSSPPTLEQWMHDALAVMDDAGSQRAAVFAPQNAALDVMT